MPTSTMKLLLSEKVPNLGGVGDVVEVADGYGRNFLLPQKKAVIPTRENIRRIELEKAKILAQLAEEKEEFLNLCQAVEDASLTLNMKASEEGHLYGSVTTQVIAEQMEEEGLKILEKWIALEEPIKELGVFDVDIKFPHDISTQAKIWVVAEE